MQIPVGDEDASVREWLPRILSTYRLLALQVLLARVRPPEHAFTLGSDRIQPKTPPANARGRIYPKWSLSLTKDVESSRCDLIGVAGCGGNRAGKFALLGAAAPTKPVHVKVNDWRGE